MPELLIILLTGFMTDILIDNNWIPKLLNDSLTTNEQKVTNGVTDWQTTKCDRLTDWLANELTYGVGDLLTGWLFTDNRWGID